ncbi:conserved hypothetical protein [Altererythrobacter sp. B11]|uniref:TetR/AcrR family transcriptional regulator n=1 Tax=Altererythrobacter sp. B11 TaxID=2060312 RepID=UPI000DC7170D|nr:TetR family transcriptional regulator [Altererythrobacter sp. B11]BBC72453.1 conserved hypothetical protein [Altererythrobacter sp. B11]
MSQPTRLRLLAAAEQVILREGVTALTVRRVGEVSGLNPTLVTYHFGSVAGLLGELCECNLGPMREAWAALDQPEAEEFDTDELLRIWLGPLLAPAAFDRQGRALVVLDEIAAHGAPEPREAVWGEMAGVATRVHRLLAPRLPWLAAEETAARLRYIAGAALGPPPRRTQGADAAAQARELERLCRFAGAALGGDGG